MENSTKALLKSFLSKFIFIILIFFTLHFLYKLIHANILTVIIYFILFLICFASILSYISIYFFIQYKNNTFLKRKKAKNSTSSKILRYSYLSIIIVITLIFGYKTFIFDSKFEPYILRKLFHPEKNITITLSSDNIYTDEFQNIISDISNEVTLPKELYVSGDFKVFFNHDGTITSINALLYGKNKKGTTDSFFIDYNYNEGKKLSLTLNKDVNPQYDEKYSIDPLINYLSLLPLEYATSDCNSNTFGISYSGEKTLAADTKGVVYINSKGITKESTNPYIPSVTGYTISLFVPNQQTVTNSLKYIITDNLDTVDGETTTSIYRSDLSNIGKQISKTLDDGSVEFKLDDTITYTLKCTKDSINPSSFDTEKTYTLYKYNKNTNESIVLNDAISSNVKNINLTFINENIGFLSPSCEVVNPTWILLRTEDGGKTFEKVIFENQLIESITQNSQGVSHIQVSTPYEQNGILYLRLQSCGNAYKDGHYSLCKSEDNDKTWSFVKTVRYFSSDEDNNFNGGGWFIKLTFSNAI